MGNGSFYTIHLCFSAGVYACIYLHLLKPSFAIARRSHPRDAHFSFVELDLTNVISPKRRQQAAEGYRKGPKQQVNPAPRKCSHTSPTRHDTPNRQTATVTSPGIQISHFPHITLMMSQRNAPWS